MFNLRILPQNMEDMTVNFKQNKPPFWEVKCIPLVKGIIWGSVTLFLPVVLYGCEN